MNWMTLSIVHFIQCIDIFELIIHIGCIGRLTKFVQEIFVGFVNILPIHSQTESANTSCLFQHELY